MREAVQAYLFGATLLVDAFVISFNFPEMIQTLFFSGATSAFLIPVCSRYLEDREELSRVYSLFMNVAIIVTAMISIILLAASGPVMQLIAPGFTTEGRYVARYLFIIMIPVIPLHAMLSVMKAFLNAREHFAAPELSGIIWNVIFILAALTISGTIGIYSLAVGVTLGAVAQVILQIPYLRRLGIRYEMRLPLGHPSLNEAKRLFTGALIATSVVPINSFVGRILASFLPAGEVASLAYAFRIFILPFSLFAVPTYTVLFSKLSRLFHEEDWKGINAHVDSSLVLVCITLIPSTIFLCVAGDVVIRLLYQRGAFTAKDTLMTYRALSGYSLGLIFYALSISFVRIFNARHDMKTPALRRPHFYRTERDTGLPSHGASRKYGGGPCYVDRLFLQFFRALYALQEKDALSAVPENKRGDRTISHRRSYCCPSAAGSAQSLGCKTVRILRPGMLHYRGCVWPLF